MYDKAALVFESGEQFAGTCFGEAVNASGRAAILNGPVGLTEFITDPASAGLAAVMTHPLAGNCGINMEDLESGDIWISALAVREKCQKPGGWRCDMELDAFLRRQKVPGLEGIDTRALTRFIRRKGAVPVRLRQDNGAESPVKEYRAQKRVIPGRGPRIAVIDLGVRKSVLARLREPDIDGNLFIFPGETPYEEIKDASPALVLVTNGPDEMILTTKDTKNTKKTQIIELLAGLNARYPVYGMGLGAVLTGMALGAEAEPLHNGHHGSSITVKAADGGLYVTEQNHRYTLKLLPGSMKAEFVNVNDGSAEGFSAGTAYGVMFSPSVNRYYSRSTAFFYERIKEKFIQR
jgi:carbamoyl-phosphate synthase small subunit